jgi:hypothetical protein
MLALAGPPRTAAELHDDTESLVKTVALAVERLQRLDLVRGLYNDAIENENAADYFEHVGLPPEATWEQFRALYAVGNSDDDVDVDHATNDLVTFPPIAAAIAERQAQSEA